MTMDLYPLFNAIEGLWVGGAIRQSVWLFPVIEAVHLLALALLGGAVLVLDLRLMGLGLTTPTPAELERQTRPWARGALAGLVLTGGLLFTSEALKLLGNTSFWVKMAALAAVLLFTAAVRNPHARQVQRVGARSRVIGAVSLLLWLLVAFAGRWIGFS